MLISSEPYKYILPNTSCLVIGTQILRIVFLFNVCVPISKTLQGENSMSEPKSEILIELPFSRSYWLLQIIQSIVTSIFIGICFLLYHFGKFTLTGLKLSCLIMVSVYLLYSILGFFKEYLHFRRFRKIILDEWKSQHELEKQQDENENEEITPK